MMWPQEVKKCQWPAETGSSKEGFFPEPPGGVGLGGNLEFGLGLQECEKIVFYCLKHQVCV